MLVAVQIGDLELSMKHAIKRCVRMCTRTRIRNLYRSCRTHVKFEQGVVNTDVVLKICTLAFPTLWVSCSTPFCISLTDILIRTGVFSCTLIDRLLAFCVLTWPSVLALQWVSTPRWLAFFRVLTSLAVCALHWKNVSSPCWLCALTYLTVLALQDVSASR